MKGKTDQSDLFGFTLQASHHLSLIAALWDSPIVFCDETGQRLADATLQLLSNIERALHTAPPSSAVSELLAAKSLLLGKLAGSKDVYTVRNLSITRYNDDTKKELSLQQQLGYSNDNVVQSTYNHLLGCVANTSAGSSPSQTDDHVPTILDGILCIERRKHERGDGCTLEEKSISHLLAMLSPLPIESLNLSQDGWNARMHLDPQVCVIQRL